MIVPQPPPTDLGSGRWLLFAIAGYFFLQALWSLYLWFLLEMLLWFGWEPRWTIWLRERRLRRQRLAREAQERGAT